MRHGGIIACPPARPPDCLRGSALALAAHALDPHCPSRGCPGAAAEEFTVDELCRWWLRLLVCPTADALVVSLASPAALAAAQASSQLPAAVARPRGVHPAGLVAPPALAFRAVQAAGMHAAALHALGRQGQLCRPAVHPPALPPARPAPRPSLSPARCCRRLPGILQAAHVHVPHSKVLSWQTLTAGDLERHCSGAGEDEGGDAAAQHMRRLAGAGLALLQQLLGALGALGPGRYLLAHAPGEPTCCLFKALPAEAAEAVQVGGRGEGELVPSSSGASQARRGGWADFSNSQVACRTHAGHRHGLALLRGTSQPSSGPRCCPRPRCCCRATPRRCPAAQPWRSPAPYTTCMQARRR